ncbi:hypothetical protein SAMN03080601_00467 [Alkalitalea saponilacus]|uniref:Polymerase/histidinol phosphatase N-terminal domain-containing protein n=2 Tax=Alkalitalea saponilacus TaxID=889453 RepID=A0A1T5BB74_9BACT|nr:hypothetical protein SAMN03080601_00467 [Alkalitalea saponilacus]
MKWYRADLHIHTVLSPCGGLDMTPERIIDEALKKKLDIIAITDHNTTKQCKEVMEVGKEMELMVIGGAEVNSREEVHCVTLFESGERLEEFQVFLDAKLPEILNIPEKFGHQVWVNRYEEIQGEEQRLLWSALNASMEEIVKEVYRLNGMFFPAHIDRMINGMLRQLGFVPADLKADALEVLFLNDQKIAEVKDKNRRFSIITNSDAHEPEHIGRRFTWLKMKEPSFEEVRKALNQQDGREAKPGTGKI